MPLSSPPTFPCRGASTFAAFDPPCLFLVLPALFVQNFQGFPDPYRPFFFTFGPKFSLFMMILSVPLPLFSFPFECWQEPPPPFFGSRVSGVASPPRPFLSFLLRFLLWSPLPPLIFRGELLPRRAYQFILHPDFLRGLFTDSSQAPRMFPPKDVNSPPTRSLTLGAFPFPHLFFPD